MTFLGPNVGVAFYAMLIMGVQTLHSNPVGLYNSNLFLNFCTYLTLCIQLHFGVYLSQIIQLHSRILYALITLPIVAYLSHISLFDFSVWLFSMQLD